jgi:hypothetical protein
MFNYKIGCHTVFYIVDPQRVSGVARQLDSTVADFSALRFLDSVPLSHSRELLGVEWGQSLLCC